ncbi:ComEA family DNA-binding protein [Candidatus Microgenomates bacterium]|nr:ComEA family DNA-binding protein [Candidatus Microgenomates bacterium]
MVNDQDDSSIINFDKLQELFSFYKFPFILGIIGICLFLAAIILLLKNQKDTASVLFETEASSSANTRIKVDLQGAVVSPGIFSLEEGSRIADVIALAGGLSSSADHDWVAKNLNQAAKLVDGGKIYIPSTKEVSSGKSLNNLSNSGDLSSKKTFSLNSASQVELEALPGIGPVTAGKIIAGRPYQSVDELKSRKVVTASVYEKIKDLLTVY